MRGLRWSVVLSLLLGILLSGCMGEGDNLDDQGNQKEDPEVAASTGVVGGQVVNDGFDPVAGAFVDLVDEVGVVASAVSGEDGSFEMRTVPPGLYRLQLIATCCHQHVESVLVEAGQTAQVNIVLSPLSPNDLQIPYVDRTGSWNGFLACGVSTPLSSGTNVGACDELDENADREHRLTVGPGIRSIVVGMEWDPVPTSLAKELHIRVYWGDSFTGNTLHDAIGTSPIEFVIGPTDAEDAEMHLEDVEEEQEISIQIWAAGDGNVVYSQSFSVHYHRHYWEAADAGATAIPEA